MSTMDDPSASKFLDEFRAFREGEFSELGNNVAKIAQQINVHERRIAELEKDASLAREWNRRELEELRVAVRAGHEIAREDREAIRRRLETFIDQDFRPGRQELIDRQKEIAAAVGQANVTVEKVQRLVFSRRYVDDVGQEHDGLAWIGRQASEFMRWTKRFAFTLPVVGGTVALGRSLGWW